MGATSQIALAALTVKVPRGQDGFWQIMRALDREQGEFTIANIEGASNVPRESVEHYVQRLTKGGFLKVVRTIPAHAGPMRSNVYRLLKRPANAPRLRQDGTPLPPSAQTRLWRAMRTPNGRSIAAADIAYEASLPGAAVPRKTAQRYINQLAQAGYLIATARGCYRLKPSMNTGPLPPSILKVEAVWDRNLKKLFGPAVHAAAEAA